MHALSHPNVRRWLCVRRRDAVPLEQIMRHGAHELRTCLGIAAKHVEGRIQHDAVRLESIEAERRCDKVDALEYAQDLRQYRQVWRRDVARGHGGPCAMPFVRGRIRLGRRWTLLNDDMNDRIEDHGQCK